MPWPTRSRHPSPPYNRAGEHPRRGHRHRARLQRRAIRTGRARLASAAEPRELDRDPDRRHLDGCHGRRLRAGRCRRLAVPRAPSRASRRTRSRPQRGSRSRGHALRRIPRRRRPADPACARASRRAARPDRQRFRARRLRATAPRLRRRLRRRRRAAVGRRLHRPGTPRDDDRRASRGVGQHRRVVEGESHGLLAPGEAPLPRGPAVRGPGRRAADVRERAPVRHRSRRRRALAHPGGRIVHHPARGPARRAARLPRGDGCRPARARVGGASAGRASQDRTDARAWTSRRSPRSRAPTRMPRTAARSAHSRARSGRVPAPPGRVWTRHPAPPSPPRASGRRRPRGPRCSSVTCARRSARSVYTGDG